MNAGQLRSRVEVWGNVKGVNELMEVEHREGLVKSIHAEIIPQTGSLQRQPGIETQLSRVTHKAIIRYHAGKDITQDQWLMFRGQRFDIRFILNPFMKNEKLEIFLEQIVE